MRKRKRDLLKSLRRRGYEDIIRKRGYEALPKRVSRERYIVMTQRSFCCMGCNTWPRWYPKNWKRKGKLLSDIRREARRITAEALANLDHGDAAQDAPGRRFFSLPSLPTLTSFPRPHVLPAASRLALLVAAVAGLLAVGNTALAHNATVPNSTEASDCDFIVTTVSQNDYENCNDKESFLADDKNKRSSLFINYHRERWPSLTPDNLWDALKDYYRNNCRPWAGERKTKLQNIVGPVCKRGLRKVKGPDGCEAQGKKVRILYHQHRGEKHSDFHTSSHDHWKDVHVSVDCQ